MLELKVILETKFTKDSTEGFFRALFVTRKVGRKGE